MKCLITYIKQQLTLSSDVHQQHWTSTLIVSPRIFRQISHHQQRPHLNERVNSPLCTMSMGTGFHPVTRDNTLVINSVEGAVTLTHLHGKHCRAVRRDKLGQKGPWNERWNNPSTITSSFRHVRVFFIVEKKSTKCNHNHSLSLEANRET